jgi:hypothetical protein
VEKWSAMIVRRITKFHYRKMDLNDVNASTLFRIPMSGETLTRETTDQAHALKFHND